MDLKSHNGGFFKSPSLILSTASLPIEIDGCRYETCLFAGRESDVIMRHGDIESASCWHMNKARELGLHDA